MARKTDVGDILLDIIKAAAIIIIGFIILRELFKLI